VEGTPARRRDRRLHRFCPSRRPGDSGINSARISARTLLLRYRRRGARPRTAYIPAVAMSYASKVRVNSTRQRAIARSTASSSERRIAGSGFAERERAQPWTGGVKFTRQSKKSHATTQRRKRSRGRTYYWLFENASQRRRPRTPITPRFFRRRSHHSLHLDPTDTKSLNHSRLGTPIEHSSK